MVVFLLRGRNQCYVHENSSIEIFLSILLMFVFVLLNNKWSNLNFCGGLRTNKFKEILF